MSVPVLRQNYNVLLNAGTVLRQDNGVGLALGNQLLQGSLRDAERYSHQSDINDFNNADVFTVQRVVLSSIKQSTTFDRIDKFDLTSRFDVSEVVEDQIT